jgi:hypothetical protein
MSVQHNKPLPVQPTVTSVNPDHGYQRQQNEIITITGTNFIDVKDVSFGSGITVNLFKVKDNTTIEADISIAPNAALGARDVSVTTLVGTGTLIEGFTLRRVPQRVPQRTDKNYAEKVSEFSVKLEDVAAADDTNKKALFKEELTTCDKLVCAWGDCPKVVQDCKELIESAHVEVNKENGDLIGAHNKLWQVRQRLVQASHSEQVEKWKVVGFFAWLLVALAVCVYVLLWLHLLPGETPRVAASNINVAALYSSFLFGAIGGIFDALSACSTNWTDRTFEPHYWPWYVSCPFLGALLGAVVFAVFLAGLLGTTGSGLPSSLPGNTTVNVPQNLWGNLTQSQLSAVLNAASNTAEPSVRAALILVLAFIAGFKQIAVTNFLERIAKSLFGGSNGSTAKS